MRVKSMMRASVALAALSAAAFGAAGTAAAQQPVPPENYTLDPRGVDLVSGNFTYGTTEVVIGQPGAGGLAYGRVFTNKGWRDSSLGSISFNGAEMIVSVGAISEVFVADGSVYRSKYNNGSTMDWTATTATLTDRNGAVVVFDREMGVFSDHSNIYGADQGLVTSITQPDGTVTTYSYNDDIQCTEHGPAGKCIVEVNLYRLSAIANNRGFMIKYSYWSDDADTNGYANPKKIVGLNLKDAYCDPEADACVGLSADWPSIAYDNVDFFRPLTATDQSGRITRYTYAGGGIGSVRYPESTSDDIAVAYNASPDLRVDEVTNATGTWTYDYALVGTTQTTTVAGPLNQELTVVVDAAIGRATSITDALNNTWSWQYDADLRVTRATQPEGDYTNLVYDDRSNLIETTRIPKPGAIISAIVTGTEYPDDCADPGITPQTCNKPITTTDARGGVTDYDWDEDTGQLLSVTLPAPTLGANRPQTRITYEDKQAYYHDGASTFAAGSAISMPVGTSACATGVAPACLGTVNEVKATLTYASASTPNNLQPVSTSRGSGTVPAMATVAMTYTPDGDVETVDGPLSGSADTVRYRYNRDRQAVGVVGPDPDGGGALKNRAQRITYNGRGQVELTEIGTTPGYSDGDWANFDAILKVEVEYDEDDFFRPVTSRQMSDADVVSSLQQVSYDGAGRVSCTVMRMNPATYGGLPASACTAATTGGFGPDRIAQATYDELGRVISTTLAYGTTDAVTQSVTYSANGQAVSLTDGQGNVSIMEYDGFDRMVKLRYPNAVGGGTSTTDYEQYAWNPAGLPNSFRDRDGETTNFGWDALGRQIQINAPIGTMSTVSGYDNLGRLTSTVGSSLTVNTAWDALSRLVSQSTTGLGTMTYAYDTAGRMTSLQWPDGFKATYDHDVVGAITGVNQFPSGGSASSLVTYAYNDMNQVTGVARAAGNGVATTYGYDAHARLTSLAHNAAGTSNDLTLEFTYNPAGQIVSRKVSDDDYVYTPAVAATNYNRNGLNQITSIAGAAVTYDDNGNATGIAGNTYGYDAANRLTSANAGAGAATFVFDPVSRLSSKTIGGVTTRFQYVGDQLVAEYDASGAVTKRYIPGLGIDGVSVSYDGPGTSNRSWLLADERGSVVGLSGPTGAVTAINRYDEYGVPASGNVGRFQYTGQAWLVEAGAYHYRSRAYMPQVGRFLQSDPVGYKAGGNLYAYVRQDPVNHIDPNGAGAWVLACRTISWPVPNPPGPNDNHPGPQSNQKTVCQFEPSGFVFPGTGGPSSGFRSGLDLPPAGDLLYYPPSLPSVSEEECRRLVRTSAALSDVSVQTGRASVGFGLIGVAAGAAGGPVWGPIGRGARDIAGELQKQSLFANIGAVGLYAYATGDVSQALVLGGQTLLTTYGPLAKADDIYAFANMVAGQVGDEFVNAADLSDENACAKTQ